MACPTRMRFMPPLLPVMALLSCGVALRAAPVIHEPFADADPSLSGNIPGAGLSGGWTATSSFGVSATSLSYGSLPVSGNKGGYSGGNGNASVSLGSGLRDAGLLDDGTSLWFSMILQTPASGGPNPDTGFAISNGVIVGTNNIPMSAGQQGIGWAIKNDQLRATYWNPAKNQAPGSAVPVNTTILIVGEILWGAASDTINLYRPDAELILGSVVSTQTGAVDQSTFDKLTFGLKSNTFGFDEIRFGSSYEEVIGAEPSGNPFRITEIDYTPGENTVTLTWVALPNATYVARYSLTMVDGWGADIGDSLGAAADENPGDPDTITVTFDLATFGLSGEREIYFRIESPP
jgi:hypothetical protein